MSLRVRHVQSEYEIRLLRNSLSATGNVRLRYGRRRFFIDTFVGTMHSNEFARLLLQAREFRKRAL